MEERGPDPGYGETLDVAVDPLTGLRDVTISWGLTVAQEHQDPALPSASHGASPLQEAIQGLHGRGAAPQGGGTWQPARRSSLQPRPQAQCGPHTSSHSSPARARVTQLPACPGTLPSWAGGGAPGQEPLNQLHPDGPAWARMLVRRGALSFGNCQEARQAVGWGVFLDCGLCSLLHGKCGSPGLGAGQPPPPRA